MEKTSEIVCRTGSNGKNRNGRMTFRNFSSWCTLTIGTGVLECSPGSLSPNRHKVLRVCI